MKTDKDKLFERMELVNPDKKKLNENYPMGANEDPNAPWHQDDDDEDAEIYEPDPDEGRDDDLNEENTFLENVRNKITEYSEQNNKSPINKYAYFSFNYPNDFIEKAWVDNPNIAKHLRDKFTENYNKYGSTGAMNGFYINLDGDNQQILEDWIMNNYHG